MNQATRQWTVFAAEFVRDGSLRDIYVCEADLRDWDGLARFLRDESLRLEFSGAWSAATFPADMSSLFPTEPESALTHLSIDVSGVRLCCHFFTPNEIEFDLDPAEVDGPATLQALFGFMGGRASALGKEVVLTPENLRESPIFRCRPHVGLVEHTPFGGVR